MTGINSILNKALVDYELMPQIINSFFLGASDHLEQRIAICVEKVLIEIIFNEHLKTYESKKSFMKKYEQQRKQDKKTLKLYEEKRKEVVEKLSKKYDVGDVEYIKKKKISNKPKKLDFNISTLGGV